MQQIEALQHLVAAAQSFLDAECEAIHLTADARVAARQAIQTVSRMIACDAAGEFDADTQAFPAELVFEDEECPDIGATYTLLARARQRLASLERQCYAGHVLRTFCRLPALRALRIAPSFSYEYDDTGGTYASWSADFSVELAAKPVGPPVICGETYEPLERESLADIEQWIAEQLRESVLCTDVGLLGEDNAQPFEITRDMLAPYLATPSPLSAVWALIRRCMDRCPEPSARRDLESSTA